MDFRGVTAGYRILDRPSHFIWRKTTMLKRIDHVPFAILLIATPIIAATLSLALGRYSMGITEPLQILLNTFSDALFNDGAENAGKTQIIIMGIRLPRVILGLLCGCGLAAAGAGLQALLSNPLVSPDTLGVASGASFGAAIALLFNKNLLVVQLSALIFGVLAMYITYQAGRQRGQSSIIMLVLAGTVVTALFQAMVSLIKYTADSEEKLPAITYWLMGSLNNATWKGLAMGAPVILLGVALLIAIRWKCNVLTLSEDEAKSMGVNLKTLRVIIIVAATAIIASCVSMCGQIGWIGLIVPHICRMLFGSDNSRVIPASASFGAVFMVLLDTVARSATESEIPISILTAVVGAPFFIILLKKTGGGWK